MLLNATKVCTRCRVEKPHTEFFRDSRKPDGRYLQCKPCKWESSKASRNKHWYGLTREQYAALGTACHLCGSTTRLCVDHDHTTDKVRGLLCVKCNTALGTLGDTERSLLRVLEYVRGGAA